MRPVIDLTGRVFGKLTVINIVGSREKDGHPFWLCQCSCGGQKAVRGYSLKRGHVRSCGCLRFSPYNTGASRTVYASAEQAAWTFNYNQYIRNARARSIFCTISFEEFKFISSQSCHYCGTPPEQRPSQRGRASIFASGIDRKDNSIGYTSENIVPCCTWCNRAKNNHSLDEFIRHCIKVANISIARSGYVSSP